MSRNGDPTVLSFHESLLRQSDVALLLQGPHWLNDRIISFYFEYLDMVAFKDNRTMLFISPEVTQCLKIVSEDEINVFLEPLDAVNKSFIFFPINDNDRDQAGGSHWSLLVFSGPENSFYHFDSLSPSNELQCEKLIRRIKSFLSVDCGIHVLCNAENIAHHIVSKNKVDGVSKLSNDSVVRKRADILHIIIDLQMQKQQQ